LFDVEFYEKADGSSQVRDFIDDLQEKSATSKDARMRLKKTVTYIDALAQYGSRVGYPTVKHLVDDIWELRPLDDRILYFFAKGNTYVLLHTFVKKTQQTPPAEIEQAKREMKDYLERSK
jgi:phage-related protein